MSFSAASIPDQTGRTFLITGANSGLGFECSKALAAKGANVIMAVRNEAKGIAAKDLIEAEVPNAQIELRLLQLDDLEDIARFSKSMHDDKRQIDVLINNAGVMMTPKGVTKQGFETQFGTNHLGHFALTLSLLDLMKTEGDVRAVTVSSNLHRSGQINFDDLQGEQSYSPTRAYSQSKIANVYFGLELARKCATAGLKLKSIVAHPGYASTNLQYNGPTGLTRMLMPLTNALFAQSAEAGAWPLLFAATIPDVNPATYIGPMGFMHMKGEPGFDKPVALAQDREIAKRLWAVSEELTGVKWPY